MSDLTDVLGEIATQFNDKIDPTSDKYCLIDLGKAFEVLGKQDADKYRDVRVVVPLKQAPKDGIAIQVRGSDLASWLQLDTGLAVPPSVAKEAELPSKPYAPERLMLMYLG